MYKGNIILPFLGVRAELVRNCMRKVDVIDDIDYNTFDYTFLRNIRVVIKQEMIDES